MTDGGWIIRFGMFGWFGYVTLFGLFAAIGLQALRAVDSKITSGNVSLAGLHSDACRLCRRSGAECQSDVADVPDSRRDRHRRTSTSLEME